ncbi:MAG: ACP S-malonyltransferase [Chloroflexi bacterium]|nr:ACP S-malonyltransferase [Chloroflexota bacterium]MCL5074103.1 ACP S-malonyltransferase [Chloroflexota bacterium]
MSNIGFVFPGQGSQFVGMGKDLYDSYHAAREVFHVADEVLGFPLSKMCFEGPEPVLRQTINAQPAILTVSIAVLQALRAELGNGFEPALLAGHSLGEYSALVAAGSLDFSEAIWLVRERGRLAQEVANRSLGGMVAIIGLADSVLEEICTGENCHGVICIANYNSPGQVVLSGERQALQWAVGIARERGARRVIPLAVDGPFHSPLMQPAAEQFTKAVARLCVRPASVPVVGNISAQPLQEVTDITAELVQQLTSPVRWTQSVRYMRVAGLTTFVEIGPGQILCGLIKRIVADAETISLNSVASLGTLRQDLSVRTGDK